MNALRNLLYFLRQIRGTIIRNDDLIGDIAALLFYGCQTIISILKLIIHGDHDRYCRVLIFFKYNLLLITDPFPFCAFLIHLRYLELICIKWIESRILHFLH